MSAPQRQLPICRSLYQFEFSAPLLKFRFRVSLKIMRTPPFGTDIRTPRFGDWSTREPLFLAARHVCSHACGRHNKKKAYYGLPTKTYFCLPVLLVPLALSHLPHLLQARSSSTSTLTSSALWRCSARAKRARCVALQHKLGGAACSEISDEQHRNSDTQPIAPKPAPLLT